MITDEQRGQLMEGLMDTVKGTLDGVDEALIEEALTEEERAPLNVREATLVMAGASSAVLYVVHLLDACGVRMNWGAPATTDDAGSDND